LIENVERRLSEATGIPCTSMNAGTTHVVTAESLFGGTKMSGVGREGGRYSMEEMTELKWVTVQIGQRQFPF
jgi:acyl-CoA reductase-like NAD-dependent aldehyde dehydrogenase